MAFDLVDREFIWQPLRDFFETGSGITVSTGSTASTCSLNVDFNLVDWPASVSTIQILAADIWRAEIDTLEAGRVTADSLTMLGVRWDDGAGKLLASAFPDSADFASMNTASAIYVENNRWDDGNGKIDGEQIADDTVDDDALDLGVGVDQISLGDFLTGAGGEIICYDLANVPQSMAVTGDIAVDNTANATINADKVDADALKDDNAPADEDFYRYESTGSTGHWTAAGEIPQVLNSSVAPQLDSGRYGTAYFSPDWYDSLTFYHAGVASQSTIICGWRWRPPYTSGTVNARCPFLINVVSHVTDSITVLHSPLGKGYASGDTTLWYYILGAPQ